MSQTHVSFAFELDLVLLPLSSLLPLGQVADIVKQSPRYRCIAESLEEIGLVEPLVVYRKPDRRGRYLLLDGLLRWTIMRERGQTEAECLLAKDDEAFTYNKRVNRLALVQEHFMIVRAIERGVPEEKLAKALGVNIEHIRRRRKLLHGICEEAAGLLRDKVVNPVTFNVLRKMKAVRQVEACQLMVSASNYSSSYAKALLSATKDADRVRSTQPKRPQIVTSADLALMERELKAVRQGMEKVELSYGRDMLDLVIATAYIAKLLTNDNVSRYLTDNHPEMLKELNSIVSSTSLHRASPSGTAESRVASDNSF